MKKVLISLMLAVSVALTVTACRGPMDYFMSRAAQEAVTAEEETTAETAVPSKGTEGEEEEKETETEEGTKTETETETEAGAKGEKRLDLGEAKLLESALVSLVVMGRERDDYDHDLTRVKEVYAGRSVGSFLYLIHLGTDSVQPDKGTMEGEWDGYWSPYLGLYSVGYVQDILYSLTGRREDIQEASKDGVIGVDLMEGDGHYLECKNWRTEPAGDGTWKVYVEVYNDLEEIKNKLADLSFTVVENPESIFDGWSITDVEAIPPADHELTLAYIDYYRYLCGTDGDRFQCRMIYLDDDAIPELYVSCPDLASGSRLIWRSQSGVNEEWIGFDCRYMERGGLLHYMEGRAGYLSESVCRFAGGELETIGIGEQVDYIAMAEYQGEDPGTENPDVRYQWNGEEVSKEDYQLRRDALFDSSRAISLEDPSDAGLMTREAMCDWLLSAIGR